MSAEVRERILARVRASRPPPEPHPGPFAGAPPAGSLASLRSGFAAALAAAGGLCEELEDVASLGAAVQALPEWRASSERCDATGSVGGASVELAGVADPRALAGLGFAVVPGELGVAENGAVWVAPQERSVRAACFLAEHLALVVPAAALVATLHDAYARIAMPEPGFGCFVAGPSKTADIEQSLVLGAHGPRSLRVFLLGPRGEGRAPG